VFFSQLSLSLSPIWLFNTPLTLRVSQTFCDLHIEKKKCLVSAIVFKSLDLLPVVSNQLTSWYTYPPQFSNQKKGCHWFVYLSIFFSSLLHCYWAYGERESSLIIEFSIHQHVSLRFQRWGIGIVHYSVVRLLLDFFLLTPLTRNATGSRDDVKGLLVFNALLSLSKVIFFSPHLNIHTPVCMY
jgi:hypothetical protein